MDPPSIKRTFYVQKAPDMQRPIANMASSARSLFGNCFTTELNSVVGDNDQEDLLSIQEADMVTFCHSLRLLKDAFYLTEELSSEQVISQLKQVNAMLAESLKKYPSLYAKDLIQIAALVNSKIKGYFAATEPEIKARLSNIILCAIDKLSFAFNRSLSGESPSSLGAFHRTESFENLNLEQGRSAFRPDSEYAGDEIDGVFLSVSGGIDRALQYATSWLDSARFIATYIEKRTAFEVDLAKHLMRLAVASQQMRSEILPLQSTYLMAFNLDAEIADGIHKFCTTIQTEKFLQPLSMRCAEHKKSCKDLKDLWSKEERQMREAVENLRRSKAAYNARCRELMKTKEATQRAIADSNILNDVNALIRLEKRRKMEEDAVAKVTSTQEHYQRCISIANDTKTQMNMAKKRILMDVRRLIDESDRILKMATTDYFSLMATRTAAIPLQFQALRKSCEQYEPGSVYAHCAEMLGSRSSVLFQDEEPFAFEPYSPSVEDQDKQFTYMKRIHDFRKRISLLPDTLASELSQDLNTKRILTKENSDSGASVSRSLDSSPVLGRRSVVKGHKKLTSSSSFDVLTDFYDDKDFIIRSDYDDVRTVRGLVMSKVAQMHEFKRLRTFARCRQCDCYIYFNGFECSLCGLSCHKTCLRNLRWECGHLKGRSSSQRHSHSDRPPMIAQKGLPDQVPYVVKKCIEQIDADGLQVKGIFRVSAAKSRVESLFQKLKSEDDMIDLSSESPHTIAGLIRQYLRELDEPLIAFQTCDELVNLVKNSNQTANSMELIEQMKSLLNSIPGENFWTLSCLMHHLKRVSQFSEVNLMSASNLSVVFGPTLMRSSNDMLTTNSLVNNKHQCCVVELLITNAKEIFGLDPISSDHPTSEDPTSPVSVDPTTTKDSALGDCVDGFVDDKECYRSTTVWFDQSVHRSPLSTGIKKVSSSEGVSDSLANSIDRDSGSSHPVSNLISRPTPNASFLQVPRDGTDAAKHLKAASLLSSSSSSSSFQRL